MKQTLQDLVNEYGEILNKVDIAGNQLDNKEITPEQYNEIQIKEDNYPSEKTIDDSLKSEFIEYKKLCFVEYEETIENLINFFQLKEDSPEKLLEKLENKEHINTKEVFYEVEKQLFSNFFDKEKQINDFLLEKEIKLPDNVKDIYIKYGQSIEDEYTNWLASHADNKNTI